MMENFVRRADLFDAALIHDDDAIGHFQRFFLIVRHQDAGDMNLGVQVSKPAAEFLPHARVERTERLVKEKDTRFDGQRTRERHALALSAGELGRIVRRPTAQLNQFE